MSKLGRSVFVAIPAVLLLGLLVARWAVFVKVTAINQLLLPSPRTVFETTWTQRSLLLSDARVTLKEVAVGFVLGVAIGMLCGILIAESRLMERTIFPVVITSQAIPVFSLAPLLVIWFGFGLLPKVLLAALIVFFPICVNQVEGLRSADQGTVNIMRAFGASRLRIFRTVRFPASIPSLIAGMQLGVTYAVVGAVIAEWLGANQGLGYRMVAANALSETNVVFAAILVTAAVSVLLFALIRIAGNLLFPWQRRQLEET
jgi:ABC-type nitrate/sulfonate/bicarbonate transport system permease component